MTVRVNKAEKKHEAPLTDRGGQENTEQKKTIDEWAGLARWVTVGIHLFIHARPPPQRLTSLGELSFKHRC